jgi:hypothetical protein
VILDYDAEHRYLWVGKEHGPWHAELLHLKAERRAAAQAAAGHYR